MQFVIDASEKVFRVKKGRFCPVVSDPLLAPNGQLYKGAMVIVHPHYSGRAIAKFYDNRGLGRYAAIALRGVGVGVITLISVYITPSPCGGCGQAAAQQRYIDSHKGWLPTSDPYTLIVMDIAELVAERHRVGSSVVVGGGLQTDAAGGSKVHSQLTQKHWGREDLILPSLDEDSSPWSKSKQASRPPTYYKG